MFQENKVASSLSLLDAYIFQLRVNKAFGLCGGSIHEFVLQDFSEETLLLKVCIY